MQIVIDISEEVYNHFEELGYMATAIKIVQALNKGVVLPRGHGRLIDADALKMDKRVCGDRYLSGSPLFVANEVIEQAPTIIEADKEAENETN